MHITYEMTCHTLHAMNVGGGGGGGERSDKWYISYYLLIFKFIITTANNPPPPPLELFLLSGYIMCVCGVGGGGGWWCASNYTNTSIIKTKSRPPPSFHIRAVPQIYLVFLLSDYRLYYMCVCVWGGGGEGWAVSPIIKCYYS